MNTTQQATDKSILRTSIKQIKGYTAKKRNNLVVYEPNSLIKDIYYSVRAIL